MILVRTFNGGSLSFRTPRGTIQAKLKDGFMYVEVDSLAARQMQLIHKFHKPPSGFSLSGDKKEVKEKSKQISKSKTSSVAEPKPAAPKKKTTRRKKKKTS